MGFLVAGGIILLIGVYVFSTYNGFIKIRNAVEEAFSTMDVYLKKRYDLIPNLVETVKGYAKHEQETFQKIVEARAQAMNATTIEEKQASENVLTGTLKSLFALSENYPELKADSQFLDLQRQLQKVEEDIAQSRKYYNAVVKTMNTKVESFPSNIVAMLFGFKRATYFTADETERENVQVQF
ncbi:MAG TPA: LemA family protein [Tissierellaceae bacterium]|jgi:LemA protein|nr:LemA family protein [Tissierellaceae bacterium]